MRNCYVFLIGLLFSFSTKAFSQQVVETDLLIVGGGASGVTAGIQASRMSVNTLIIEETEWLGGMLTSAGVSAIDGNHQLPSGLWGEFRANLYQYYGGPAAVETGWVSNTLFEPSVGNKILKKMADNPFLKIWYKTGLLNLKKDGNGWIVKVKTGNKERSIKTKLVIDGTELGDVMAKAGARYDIGMDSRSVTKEIYAPEKANDIIQDLTYVVVLKDYGKGANKTIKKPQGYNPEVFKHSCDVADPAATHTSPDIDCTKMITYGKLPNGKYMINWPKEGNDIYLNIIEKTPEEREMALQEAKLHTLRFVYYLQTVLGYKNLGIADDEFPTKDKLPMIPYHRESRRLDGMVRLTLPYVSDPYAQEYPWYRTGVIVGDYTIDHHHLKNPDAPQIDFVKIKVPSYNVPLGSLIPKSVDGLIVAEKSISVSNIVAGATRLQPVVLGIGQAAGTLAALAIKKGVQPREVKVREVQSVLLNDKAYLLPFIDVKPEHENFKAIQRIGATGILKGKGISYKWANQTWFYPNHPISEYDLVQGLKTYYPALEGVHASGKDLEIEFFAEMIHKADKSVSEKSIVKDYKKGKKGDATLTRADAAVLIDKYLNPFSKDIDIQGNLK